jgi:hypothetical protein
MKIKDYKKLEKKIIGQTFNENYKTINIVMTILSYFGNIASIFLAYFMLSNVLKAASDNFIAILISSIIILIGLELLKRDIFDKFSIQYLKFKSLGKEVLPLFLLSLLIISISFYSSITGASEFSSKSDKIEVDGKENIRAYGDSLTKNFNNDTKIISDNIKKNDDMLTVLRTQALSERPSRNKLKISQELIKEKDELSLKIKDMKDALDIKIQKNEESTNIESSDKKKDNSKDSFMFVIISTLIELVILAGVFFSEYYKFKSYKEFRDIIEKDPSYQKWLVYNQMMDIIYTEDTKINQKLPSAKAIIDICKASDLIVLPKDLLNFMKILSNLNIIKVSGSAKYFNKQREISLEILQKHFNIE